jgi:hypothetical protein
MPLLTSNAESNSACVASTLRLAQLHDLNGVDVTCKLHCCQDPLGLRTRHDRISNDIIDQTVGALNWSTAEVGTAIVCSCMSAIRPLASKIFPKFFQRLFTQASSPSLDTYGTAKLSKSSKSQTGPQSLASHSDDAFELIHQRPDTAEHWPPATLPEMPFQKVVISRN